MRFILILTVVIIIAAGCKTTRQSTQQKATSHTATSSINHFVVEVIGYDLSEDMSPFSTHNDELLLAIFCKQKNGTLKLIAHSNFTIDTEHRGTTLSYSFPFISTSQPLYFFLLELDSDNATDKLLKTIQANYKEIIANSSDYNQLNNYLGDDDLIGYYLTPAGPPITITFKGREKMDKFHYELKVISDSN